MTVLREKLGYQIHIPSRQDSQRIKLEGLMQNLKSETKDSCHLTEA
jgi:hypothetical protein